MTAHSSAQLLAIVEVPVEKKVLCGQSGCGHGVWKAIHVVIDGGELLVIGSTCFERRYGSGQALGSAKYGGSHGRKLTFEERQLLVENTAAFVAVIKEEERLSAALGAVNEPAELAPPACRTHDLITTRIPVLSKSSETPWTWMKPLSSVGYFSLRDGSGWVRVQRKDGLQILVPWPIVDGWDEALPAHVGPADVDVGGYILSDVVKTVAYLQSLGDPCRVFSSWRELAARTRGL